MTDAAYQNALQRRANLLKELERLNIFISVYEEMTQPWGQNASADSLDQNANNLPTDPQEVVLEAPAGAAGVSESPRKRATGNPKPRDVVEEVKAILARRGHPMTRRQLLAELNVRGMVIQGRNPMKVLGTNLWRAGDELVSLEGHGYWFKDQQYHPAGYYPPASASGDTSPQ